VSWIRFRWHEAKSRAMLKRKTKSKHYDTVRWIYLMTVQINIQQKLWNRFTLSAVGDFVYEGFEEVTPARWQSLIRHTRRFIINTVQESYYLASITVCWIHHKYIYSTVWSNQISNSNAWWNFYGFITALSCHTTKRFWYNLCRFSRASYWYKLDFHS